MRLPGGDLTAKLADRLYALDYTVEGVRRFLGPIAADALDRQEAVPALRVAVGADSPLAVAISVLLLGESVRTSRVEWALRLTASELDDLVVSADGQTRACIELAPYAADDYDWFVASDWSSRRTGLPTAADHVIGVGGAATMLAQSTVRPDVDRALDLGTGCGVQAFHLAEHAATVVGTDISDRCLQLAAFNAALNGIALDLRQGSLFAPVKGELFDLIVSNPPFVIGSPPAARHDYRDSGFEGDAVCASVLRGAADHLAESGWCQLLANWEITDGDDWARRPREWVDDSGLDAWVIQRDVQDPAAYIEMWLRDAGGQRAADYRSTYDAWMSTLERRRVLGIGFGLITVRRTGRATPVQRFQHVPQPWVQPVAPDVERWFAVQDAVAGDPASVLGWALRVAPDVVVEEHRQLADAEPVVLLRRSTGMAWSGPIDAFGLDLLARLDGVRPAAEGVLEAAAEHSVAPETALTAAVPILSQLTIEGFLL